MPYDDANQVKFIQAHQIAKNTWRNANTPRPGVPAGDAVRELGGQRGNRDHEGEVEQQLEFAGGAMRFVDRARAHPDPNASVRKARFTPVAAWATRNYDRAALRSVTTHVEQRSCHRRVGLSGLT